jgi:hypothetical protein
MLNIKDLAVSKELETREMAEVRGGFDPFSIFGGTSITSHVADVTQGFAFELAQGNVGTVTNNQAIQGGNGVSYAPVTQTQKQDNYMDVYDVGNVHVG